MLLARLFSRRRLCLAAALVAVAGLAAIAMIAPWGARSAEHVRYGEIQTGMTEEQVEAILGDWLSEDRSRYTEDLFSPVGGPVPDGGGSVIVFFSGTRWAVETPSGAEIVLIFDSHKRLTVKEFKDSQRSPWQIVTGLLRRVRLW